MDNEIKSHIEDLKTDKRRYWLNPIISLKRRENCPYLTKEFEHLTQIPEVADTPAGKSLLSPLTELKTTYPTPESTLSNNNNPHDIPIKSRAAGRMNAYTGMLRTRSNSGFGERIITAINNDVPEIPRNMKKFTISMSNIEFPFTVVEPILVSVFFYSLDKKKIISESCSYIPEQARPFFNTAGIPINCESSLSFSLDSMKTQLSTKLIIMLKHPLKNDNVFVDYYTSPNETTQKQLPQNFEICYKTPFSTFAFTYCDFNSVKNAVQFLKLPQVYIVNTSKNINDIEGLISDANKGTLRQINVQVSVGHKASSNVNEDLIARSISNFRFEPFLSLIHQIAIHFNKIEFSSLPKKLSTNYVISVRLFDAKTNYTYRLIRSRYDPKILVEIEYTDCVFRNSSPKYIDTIVVDLPYPVSQLLTLEFKVLDCSLDDSHTINEVGMSSMKLITENGLLSISSGNHQIPIQYTNQKGAVALSKNYIDIDVLVRSNLITYDENYYNYITGKSNSIAQIKPEIVVENMVPIFNKIIEKIAEKSPSAFEELLEFHTLASQYLNISHFERYLNIYALVFSFNQEITYENFHVLLTEQFLNAVMTKGIVSFLPYVNFVFTLIIKYYVLNDILDDKTIIKFGIILQFIQDLKDNDLMNDIMISIGQFVNLLFEANQYTLSIMFFSVQSNFFSGNFLNTDLKSLFFESVLKPKFFYLATKFFRDFSTVFSSAIHHEYLHMNSTIFTSLDNLFKIYDDKIMKTIADYYTSTIFDVKANQLNATSTDVFRYLSALLSHIEKLPKLEKLLDLFSQLVIRISSKQWFDANSSIRESKELPEKSVTFWPSKNIRDHLSNDDSVIPLSHSTYVRKLTLPSRIALNQQQKNGLRTFFSILIDSVTKNINEIGSHIDSLLLLTYKLLFLSNSSKINGKLINMFICIFNSNPDKVFNNRTICVVKIFKKIFYLIAESTDIIQPAIDMFQTIFEIDKEIHNSNSISIVLFIRTISLLNIKDKIVNQPNIKLFMNNSFTNEALQNCIDKFKKVHEVISTQQRISNKDYEAEIETLYQQLTVLNDSPDATFDTLSKIIDIYNKTGKKFTHEIIICIYTQLAIIAEHLTILQRIPNYYALEHPAELFEPYADMSICKFSAKIIDDIPNVPTYCDSLFFTENSYFALLYKMINVCHEEVTNSHYVIKASQLVINHFWANLEFCHSYSTLSAFFNRFSQEYEKVNYAVIQNEVYYRVSFYGPIYLNENTFIYRAEPYSNVRDFALDLEDHYRNLCKDIKIKVASYIPTNQPIDHTTLDPKKVYLQIHSVLPVASKCDDNHIYNQFYFDTMTSKKSGVENYTKRRTILTTVSSLPFITARLKAKNIEFEDFCPIQFQVDANYKFVDDLLIDLEKENIGTIDLKLAGALSPQVNEGPLKAAEIFLSNPSDDPFTGKLRISLKRMLVVMEKALEYFKNNTGEILYDEKFERFKRNMIKYL